MARRFDVIHACVSDAERARASVSARMERAGRKVVHVDAALLEERLDAIEVLVCGEAPRIDWSRAHRLRLLQLMGSGTETLWPATGLPPQAEIANARGIHLPEMRDHVLALLLAFERELPRALAQHRERRWSSFPAGSLQGKTVAVLGLGEVGRAVAAACSGLGMRVIGTCAQPRPTPHVDEVHGPDGLDHVLGAADYVVVLLPLTARTRGLIDGRALS
jgi:phosphoglycerate dehydrogenase-like enzyme